MSLLPIWRNGEPEYMLGTARTVNEVTQPPRVLHRIEEDSGGRRRLAMRGNAS